jgi:tetratricopeptide (TPR) repeat protein
LEDYIMVVDDERRKRSEELADTGFALIREGNYEEALGIAGELEELRFSAAFDIAAQAHSGLGDLQKAVETLERGVAKAPTCWLNWELLGSCRSDMGDYSGAEGAYEQALTCPAPSEDSIRLNQAILANRRGNHAQALNYLDMVGEPGLSLRAAVARITALEGMGRIDEALSVADACLAKEWEEEDVSEWLSYIAASQGRMRLGKGCSPNSVRRSAMNALEEFGSDGDLLALIRDIDGCYSTEAQYFRLLIHAKVAADQSMHQEAKGYFVSYDVVAETPERALVWVQEFECADSVPATLCIEEEEVLEERPGDPMGVYWRSGRCYYMDEDEE